jgi:dinuclear metal center YbgI/SA1388 family protein
MVRVGDVARIIEEHYPLAYAVAGDNCGLQIGSLDDPVRSICIALDPSPAALTKAASRGADLLVTHHPLFFEPLKILDTGEYVGAAACDAARRGIAVYAAHTNLDAAPGGIADSLAALAGIADPQPFPPSAGAPDCKVSVFVPAAHFGEVHRAMSAAGAGSIGSYDQCAFASRGEGYFRGLEGSRPAVGRKGRLERIAEIRLEMTVPEKKLERVTSAMMEVHPYEEPAYDVYPLRGSRRGGLGRVGECGGRRLSALAGSLARRLGAHARLSGARRRTAVRAAVVPGSGGSLLRKAAGAGADTMITGEIRYHQALEADHLGVAVIELGHDSSELPAVDLLASTLRSALRDGKKKIKLTTWKSPRAARPIR